MSALVEAQSVANVEHELAAEQAARADARRSVSYREADLTEKRNSYSADPSDEKLAEVEQAKAELSKATERVRAYDIRVTEAELRFRDAQRASDRAALDAAKHEADAIKAELPAALTKPVEINGLAAKAGDAIEDLAERYSDARERARAIAARLGVTNPIRDLPLPVIRTAAGLYLADAVGLPEVEPEELRTNLGLGRAVRDLAAVRLDASDLIPAVDRVLAEIDAALGATAARWIEPLRAAGWNAAEAERERHEAAEALLAELEAKAGG